MCVCVSDVGEYLQTFFSVSKQLPVTNELAEPVTRQKSYRFYTHLYFPAHFHRVNNTNNDIEIYF